MEETILTALIEPSADGTLEVRAPCLGLWSGGPLAGTVLVAGGSAGEIRQVGRRYGVVLPADAAGQVAAAPRDRLVAVEYRQVLFHLLPRAALAQDARENGSPAGERVQAVVAPTDGVFYARPAEGAPPFVAPGSRVRAGQTVGLIEIMKTFGQIVYGGSGLPDEAEVVELRAADGEEVTAGQVLIVVR